MCLPTYLHVSCPEPFDPHVYPLYICVYGHFFLLSSSCPMILRIMDCDITSNSEEKRQTYLFTSSLRRIEEKGEGKTPPPFSLKPLPAISPCRLTGTDDGSPPRFLFSPLENVSHIINSDNKKRKRGKKETTDYAILLFSPHVAFPFIGVFVSVFFFFSFCLHCECCKLRYRQIGAQVKCLKTNKKLFSGGRRGGMILPPRWCQ